MNGGENVSLVNGKTSFVLTLEYSDAEGLTSSVKMDTEFPLAAAIAELEKCKTRVLSTVLHAEDRALKAKKAGLVTEHTTKDVPPPARFRGH